MVICGRVSSTPFYRRVRRGGRPHFHRLAPRFFAASNLLRYGQTRQPDRSAAAAERFWLVEAGLKNVVLLTLRRQHIFAPDFAGSVLPVGDPGFSTFRSLRLSNQTRCRSSQP
ncbi:hypothetical protein KCP76_06455 [Salmonella enterica subsp. enterica serovar Weltevreden]|nr:hypothetical protein KCP76_06455 [Salmonella enterica subsp. enterica serovar Weltevreden]